MTHLTLFWNAPRLSYSYQNNPPLKDLLKSWAMKLAQDLFGEEYFMRIRVRFQIIYEEGLPPDEFIQADCLYQFILTPFQHFSLTPSPLKHRH